MNEQVRTGTAAAAFCGVPTDSQESRNQVRDVEAFASHHGHAITMTYTVSDSAWKDGEGAEYRKALQRAPG